MQVKVASVLLYLCSLVNMHLFFVYLRLKIKISIDYDRTSLNSKWICTNPMWVTRTIPYKRSVELGHYFKLSYLGYDRKLGLNIFHMPNVTNNMMFLMGSQLSASWSFTDHSSFKQCPTQQLIQNILIQWCWRFAAVYTERSW